MQTEIAADPVPADDLAGEPDAIQGEVEAITGSRAGKRGDLVEQAIAGYRLPALHDPAQMHDHAAVGKPVGKTDIQPVRRVEPPYAAQAAIGHHGQVRGARRHGKRRGQQRTEIGWACGTPGAALAVAAGAVTRD